MKRIVIPPGEELRLTFSGDKFAYPATYRGARGEWLFFGEDSLKVEEIAILHRQPLRGARNWIGMIRGAAGMAAIVFPAMILLNRTAVTGFEERDMGQIAAIIGASFLTRALMGSLRWRKFKLDKGKWRLRVRTPIERL